jgi:hypothetical protein
MSLIGTLSEVKLAEVLRLFASGKKTGVLTVTAGGPQAIVRFQRGAIVHAAAGRLQGDDAVLDLFGWKDGQLTFVPEEKPVVPNVTHGVDVLILEGLRMGESFHRMNELIPSDRVVFQMAAGPADDAARYSIGPMEWRVLRLLDGIRDIREIIEASKVPRGEVLRVVFEMTEAGFLERVEAQKTLRAQVRGLFGKDAAELDEKLGSDWKKISRFATGIQRLEIRTLAGKVAVVTPAFRAGLLRDIHLPRATVAELGLREGEDVFVRPIG